MTKIGSRLVQVQEHVDTQGGTFLSDNYPQLRGERCRFGLARRL
jgi:hypothetical protein